MTQENCPSDLDLTDEEYEILLAECQEIMTGLKKREWQLVLDLKDVRKEMNQVRNEKDYLMSLKAGSNWAIPLTGDIASKDTMDETKKRQELQKSLTLRYKHLITRFSSLNG